VSQRREKKEVGSAGVLPGYAFIARKVSRAKVSTEDYAEFVAITHVILTSMDDDEEQKPPITLFDLDPNDWIEIKKIAIKYHEQGTFRGDQLKCGILAFIQWLAHQEDDFALGTDMDITIH
jgi:hypothetical protein